MSRVGTKNNVTQPDARCMSCKRWKSASKRGFFDFAESGHCSLPYCEKDARNKGKRGIDMIKSDFGTIEVDGREPVIMTEFETLLVALRRVLGEEKYNRALQRANENELSKKDTETLRSEEKERMAEVIKAILSGMEDK